MYRKKIFLLAGLFLLLSLFGKLISAQTPTAIPTGTGQSDLGAPYNLSCVQIDGLDTKGYPPPVDDVTFSGNCSSSKGCYIAVCSLLCEAEEERENNNGETVKRCVPGAKVEVCTTFNRELDLRFFGKVGITTELPKPIVNSSNPNMFPAGNFNVKGKINTNLAKGHRVFSIYALAEPNPLPTQPLGQGEADNNNEENPSQQLGTVPFVFPTTGQPLPTGTVQKCVSAFWDPYGRVFDSVSLEPLDSDEARVTLYHEDGSYVNVPSNNFSIDNLGKYNIFIKEDGRYTLKVDSMLLHNFVAVDPNSKYTNLYETIFRAGDPAFEEKQASPKRMDIPVKPKSTPYSREIEWIYKNQNIVVEKGVEYTKIEFRVSHPLTKIKSNISGGVKCVQTNADYVSKDGFCTFVIKSTLIPQTGIKINLIKNPDYYLYGTSTSTISFDPILRHIEGYAYDANGKAIVKAKVNVRYVANDKIFFTTISDDSGFFTIFKNNLPPLEYYLEFVNPVTSSTTIQTTSEFVKNNYAYIDSEAVNLMAITKSNQPIVNPMTGELNNIIKNNNLGQNKTEATRNTFINPTVLILLIIIALLTVVALGLIFYIRRIV